MSGQLNVRHADRPSTDDMPAVACTACLALTAAVTASVSLSRQVDHRFGGSVGGHRLIIFGFPGELEK